MQTSTLSITAALLLAPAGASAQAAPTADEAKAFVAGAEKQMSAYSDRVQRVFWVNATYLTDDTDQMSADAGAEGTLLQVRLAKEAARFNSVTGLDADTSRKLFLLRQAIVLPAPDTQGAAEELATITTRLQSTYGKGKGTVRGVATGGNDIEALMGTERDPAVLKEMWESWHKVGQPMRADYIRMAEIANAGARELGFADTGAMWRAGYDMPAADFEKLIDKLLAQVQPLYVDLHCYTRTKLNEKYGDGVQAKTGPIRADLLGNMWAQEWAGIYDVVAPAGAGDIGYDIGDLLTAKGADPIKMVRYGEAFYSSLGFAPLPDSFWSRSMFTKPADREVVCHASAWDLDNKDDIRIKMCIKVNANDFVTIHHELGHNYYQRAYKAQPLLYLNSANDGFHEAIGDFAALNVTPEYLVKVGLLDAAKVPDPSKDIGLLLRQALEKVPGMPWTALVDKWRWGVFSGATTPAQYNKAWTDLRLKYQGITPPGPRSEADFDPGAKYHIPGNTPYARYFLARVLQFQFYQSACAQAGWKGPLHRCSIYGDKAVGAKLNAMLEMGMSKPWPEALKAFAGTGEMSGKAMTAYFAPLHAWLKKQNKGQQCGWS
ncbi:M2 family metallopeptidase [Sandarakinorhabdus sp.]|uniref:M2 family metallopeptidase n=1 Tax=Sandarakinorhabdus sp. TaxID=1916663 RepID=UPI00286DEBFB|nr:M2 family metallopeptidase [Sandarakinorhabdus sp.]